MEQLKDKDRIELVIKKEDEERDGFTISLRDILETLIRGKWIVLASVIACLLAVLVFTFVSNNVAGVAKTIISFNYEGIEKGLDPKGKNLDLSTIKAPFIIDKVVANLGLDKEGISTESIRSCIEIEPIIPDSITKKIELLTSGKNENIEEMQSFVYYPSSFIISYNVIKGSKVDKAEAVKILDETVKVYRDYFYDTFTDRAVLANAIGSIDYDGYDYPEISMVIRGQIDIIKNYLDAKGKEKNASEFRSKANGMSFADISAAVDILDTVELNRLDSLISSFNITKDRDKLIKLYEQRIKMLELDMAKKEDESKIVSEMLNKYQKDKSLLLAPTAGAAGGSVMEYDNTSEYYNSLADRYTDAGVLSRNALHDIEFYKKEIERFKKDTVAQIDKDNATEDVLKLIPGIKAKLEKWIVLINDTVTEYYDYKFGDSYMKVLSSAQNTSASVNKLIFAVALVAGLVTGMFVVFFREYWRRSGESEE